MSQAEYAVDCLENEKGICKDLLQCHTARDRVVDNTEILVVFIRFVAKGLQDVSHDGR